MKYQTWILEKLIEKYEKSKLFADKTSARKIAFRLQDEDAVNRSMERAEEKEQFLTALEGLKQKNLIDYSWVRYEKGNLVERIWLIGDEDRIKECYHLLGRIPKSDVLDSLKELVILSLGKMKQGESEIRIFLEGLVDFTEQRRKIPRFFSEEMKLNEDILKCLIYLEQNQNEIQERIFSSSLYGDSKYFERHVKGKVISILKAVKKEQGEEFSEEECLREKGLVKWPEILEFTGKIKVYLEEEGYIDFEPHRYGAYINSLTVEKIKEVALCNIRKVLFIENKANYIWYIAERKSEEELVMYHGGCYSPVKGKWFQKIYEAVMKDTEQVEFYHWSDMDVGGFRIFSRLKETLVPELIPYRMDRESLEQYKEKGMPMEESYRRIVKEMSKDSRYAMFYDLMERMLELNIRLEQEQLLY